MASGFPSRDLRGSFGFGAGSAVQVPYQQRSDGGGRLLKRSLTELERQQQIQHALFLRSVKQKTNLTSPISPLSPIDLSSSSSSSLSSSSPLNFFQRHQISYSNSTSNSNPSDFSFTTVPAAAESDSAKESTMQNRLQELERQLLDDEDEDEVSVAGSAVTSSEWGEAIQQLISPATQHNHLSPSPTTSSSSSSSSTASCSPSPTPSRQLLFDTATAISEGNLDTVTANLAVLKPSANPKGDPDQRLTAMMMSALLSRINPPSPLSNHPIAELCSVEHQTATQMLYDLSPCFKLGLMAANQAILDAVQDQSKIHIIDFDVGQGGQYAALIHALAERSRHRPSLRPPLIKITAVSDPTFPFNALNGSAASNLRLIGDRISMLADRVGLGLRFNIVSRRASELDEATLGCEPGEALAVNFAFLLSRIADESVSPANPRDELLRRVKSLEPRVVALVEQEINFNTAPFASRFNEACAHFGSLLDSLDATVPRESADRTRVEACLARKAANSVAREGPDRVERCEVLGKWRARMGMAGFKPVPFGPSVSEPVKSRFGSIRPNPGFTFKEESGGLGFGWMGRVLTVASAWH